MALPAFLKRKASAAPPPDDATIVQQARTRARRRLIGAAVLLALGVVSFPLLFETQPRPIPVDIPIEIPRKDGLPPLAAPAKPARVATGQVSASNVSREVSEPVSAAPVPPSAAVPKVVTAATPAASAAPPRTASVPPSATAASRPAPTAEKKPAPAAATPDKPAAAVPSKLASAPAAAAAETGRFVVQVGAFSDVTAAREVRLKVEKLGMKTYTQVVETPQGKRIRVRVGPFESQDDAAKVLARLKAAKLPGAVLTL
jgi:DedD protein